jgi:DNA-binding MarR family transcriptional regulator
VTTRPSVVTDDETIAPEREPRAGGARTDNLELLALGEDLVTTAARVVRWVPRDADFGLSLAAVRLLARIFDHGPVRISDLAVAENCSQPTITNHVKKLESEHLVARAADPRDARVWMIDLTDTGRQRLAEMRHSLGTSVLPMISSLSRKDQKALREGVEAMRRLMAQSGDVSPGSGHVPPSR